MPRASTARVGGLLGLLFTIFAASSEAQFVRRVSLGDGGVEGNDGSATAKISADGRWVFFYSGASNLVPADGNGFLDIFVHDRMTAATEAISVTPGGATANGWSGLYAASDNARFVAFSSDATDLVVGDGNGQPDVFLRDRRTQMTTLVSVASSGEQANAPSTARGVSEDGRWVLFSSRANNLVALDHNFFFEHLFLRDTLLGTTELVSVDASGQQLYRGASIAFLSPDGRWILFQADDPIDPQDRNNGTDLLLRDRVAGTLVRVSRTPSGASPRFQATGGGLSADGRFIVYTSISDDIVPGDTNNVLDVFLHDALLGTTVRVSVADGGEQANEASGDGAVSEDGRRVYFYSLATNLVPGDGNGTWDVFERDVVSGTTRRVSVSTSGDEGDGSSQISEISRDGRFLTFRSDATNLVVGDTNAASDVFITGPALSLTSNQATATAGDTLCFTTYTGRPGDRVLLQISHLDGIPFLRNLTPVRIFDASGRMEHSGLVVPGVGPLELGLRSLGVNPLGEVEVSNELVIEIL